jgi:hypothetical protein
MRNLIPEIEILLECDYPLTRQFISQIALTQISRLKERALNNRSAFVRLTELGGSIGGCEFARFGEFIEVSNPNKVIELRIKIDQMDFEHELGLQIRQQLGIDVNVRVRVIDRFESIRRSFEESRSADSEKNPEVIPQLMNKLE